MALLHALDVHIGKTDRLDFLALVAEGRPYRPEHHYN